MTNEELRAARIADAKKRYGLDMRINGYEHLADVYETNWTPPEPGVVDHDVLAWREWAKANMTLFNAAAVVDEGKLDDSSTARAYLAGCTRGREGATWPKDHAFGEVPAGSEVWVRATVTDPCNSCCGVRINTIHKGHPIAGYIKPDDVMISPALASAKRGG